jgi:hypothetical protein
MVSQAAVVLCNLGACALDRLRGADPRALGRRCRSAVTVAQTDGSRQLVREEVDLLGDLRCAFGVAPALGLFELTMKVGESLAVGGLRLG